MAEAKFHLVAAVVFALLASAFMQSSDIDDDGAEAGFQPRKSIYDDKLRALLEKFRQNMSQPLPSLGLPALDPFHLDALAINLNLNGIRATGELKDLDVVGLSTFVIDRISVKIVGLHLQFRLFLEEITATTRLNISVADTLHVSGDNTYTLTGEDLCLSGDIAIAAYITDKNNLYLKNVTLDFSYGKLSVDLGSDFSFDDKLTTAVQSVVNDLLPQALDRKKQDLLTWAENKVTKMGNHLLENTTLGDLLGSLG